MTSTFKPKNAFTLAEMLITLAIIGVIAALTVPNLVQSYRKSVVETRLKKFYSTMNQAIQLSELENGDKKDWEFTDDIVPTWDKYFKNYISYVDVQEKTQNNNRNFLVIRLKDGSGFRMWSYKDFNSVNFRYFPLFSAYNLPNLSNNTLVSFTFWFAPNMAQNNGNGYQYHINKGMEPYRVWWDGKPEHLYKYKYREVGCNINEEKHYCAAIIQDNGWKIPKDFPFKF